MNSIRNIFWYATITLFAVYQNLFADETQNPESISSDLAPALLKLLGALLLILVIIYGSVWLMKRMSQGKISANGDIINVIERRYLAPKQAVCLIRVGEQHLLVGLSEHGINHIADVEIKEEPENLHKQKSEQRSTFNQVLKQAKDSLMPLIKIKQKKLETES